MGNSSSKKKLQQLSPNASNDSISSSRLKGKASVNEINESTTSSLKSSASTPNITTPLSTTPQSATTKTTPVQIKKYLKRSITIFGVKEIDLYNSLESLIFNTPGLLVSICEGVGLRSLDELSQALVILYESNANTLELLTTLIQREVFNAASKKDSAYTLFRQDSFSSKTMRFWCQMVGQQYLQVVLWPPLRDMLSDDESHYEIDPSRLVPNSSSTASISSLHSETSNNNGSSSSSFIAIPPEYPNNLLNFTNVTNEFLRAIISSSSICPVQIKSVCYQLAKITSESYPESKLQAVAGFIFLRFFIPAILSPKSGIIEGELLDRQTRGLLLISKVLQNAANGVLFGEKEGYMVPMNSFLESNQHLVTQFLTDISSTPPPTPSDIPNVPISQDAKLVALKVIHQCLVRFSHRIKYEDPEVGNQIQNILSTLETLQKSDTIYQLPPAIVFNHHTLTRPLSLNLGPSLSSSSPLSKSESEPITPTPPTEPKDIITILPLDSQPEKPEKPEKHEQPKSKKHNNRYSENLSNSSSSKRHSSHKKSESKGLTRSKSEHTSSMDLGEIEKIEKIEKSNTSITERTKSPSKLPRSFSSDVPRLDQNKTNESSTNEGKSGKKSTKNPFSKPSSSRRSAQISSSSSSSRRHDIL